MKTYKLADGNTLVFSVDGGAWETIVFRKADFKDIAQAKAEEIAKCFEKIDNIKAKVDSQGCLVIASATEGGHTSLEINVANSTAAAPLGIVLRNARMQGTGLQAARLISPIKEPFNIPKGAHMSILVDRGKSRTITFDRDITPGRTKAMEIVEIINKKLKKKELAQVTKEGRVKITSPTVGFGSKLEITPSSKSDEVKDAAAALGFVGVAAMSEPHPSHPATLVCTGDGLGVQIRNLTASPIELHFPSGSVILSAKGVLILTPADVAHGPLQRLLATGSVRLEPLET